MQGDTKWISVKKRKPEEDCLCWVMNCRGGEGGFICMYQKRYDVFKIYDPQMYNHPCVDVTHWCILPYPFSE